MSSAKAFIALTEARRSVGVQPVKLVTAKVVNSARAATLYNVRSASGGIVRSSALTIFVRLTCRKPSRRRPGAVRRARAR
jgi:hypothetical protein